MEKYIDVLGYLLAALVFSVGFLGARVHATYEATAREVREQSWRVRDALLRGDPVGPPELGAAVAVAHVTTDRVARLSRIVIRLLFAAMTVVYALAIWLLAHGASGPPSPYLITSLVFLGGVSVVVIGEFDVRKVGRDQRTVIEGSLIGWIGGLADALAAGQLAAVSTRLRVLSEMYPDWALLTELRGYVDLRAGQPSRGLQLVTDLAGTTTHLYLTPVVGTACALAAGDSAAGLGLLDQLVARKETGRHLTVLRAALALGWAHMESLAHDRGFSDEISWPLSDSASVPGETPVRSLEETALPMRQPLALDLAPAEMPDTAGLLQLLRAWHGQDTGELLRLATDAPLASAVTMVLRPDTTDAGPPIHELLELRDSAALETFGLIFLAQGRTREALRMIEHSIRIVPGRYQTHWAMAVVCDRLGWHSAADASLQKMNTLQPETWLCDVTRRVFSAPGGVLPEDQLSELLPDRFSTVECLQLSLLGIATGVTSGDHTVRERFFREFVAAALASAQRGPALAEART
jgi:hypothetical protein